MQAFKASGKPLVVSMGDLAASGGYYIAAPADEIIASPNTLTGSIGVYGVLPTLDRAVGKLGVNIDGVGTTPYSGMSLLRPMQPAVDQLLQNGVAHEYEVFLSHVASGRRKTRDEVDAIAQGRVWAGSDALRIGLVDRFGTYQDALDAAAKRAQPAAPAIASSASSLSCASGPPADQPQRRQRRVPGALAARTLAPAGRQQHAARSRSGCRPCSR